MCFDSKLLCIICLFILSSIRIFYCDFNSVNLLNKNYSYDIKYFETLVDHFTYKNDNLKFPLKYVISTKYWVKGNPILFYCGNENNVEFYLSNTGFMWELAEYFSGMVIFAEHRFYGSSLPFGNLSFSNPQYFGYLTAEQALADYVGLITYLKSTIAGAKKSPVLAIGGSYGGMLAVWLRQKYPHIVAGSLASSAPLNSIENFRNCNGPYGTITQVFRIKGSQECVKNIHRVWSVIDRMNDRIGLKNLSGIFHTCQPLDDVTKLKISLSDSIFLMSMGNYPYPSDFVGPLPAWPVTEFCKHLSHHISDQIKLLESFNRGILIYNNFTGQQKCLSIEKSNETVISRDGWSIQVCQDMPISYCMDGKTDMFYKNIITKSEYENNCKIYGVKPRWGWYKVSLWDNNLESLSNVILSNGLLDPWAAWGILYSTNKKVKIIKIPNGAHHADLRGSHPLDTPDIKHARYLEKKIIKRWIKDWYHINE